jgi:hypothetical protein
MLYKVNVVTGEITTDPIPDDLLGLDLATYQNLDTLLDPSYGLPGIAWWPGESALPALGLYQSYGDEVLTLDRARKVVLIGATVVDWTPEQIAAHNEGVVAEKWEAVKTMRDGAPVDGGRSDGGVQVGAYWFHSDLRSRVKWLGLKDSANDMLRAGGLAADPIVIDGEAVQWKTMSGQFAPVTIQLALDVVEAVKVLDKRIFKTAELHLYQLMHAYDPSTYDYATGWPLRYIDTLAPLETAPEDPPA